jgi:RNA polymerase-binding transcription factor DksA
MKRIPRYASSEGVRENSLVIQLTRPDGRRINNRGRESPQTSQRHREPVMSGVEAHPRATTVDKCRRLLLARRSELAASLPNKPNAPAELGHISEEDQPSALHGEFAAIAFKRFIHEQLELVEAALARLDLGEHSICCACGRRIAAGRLAPAI